MDFAFRTKRQLAFSDVTNPFKNRGAIPNLPEALLAYIPGRHGQLYASVHFAVRRKVTTIVACAARQVFVGRIFDTARNCASKKRGRKPVLGGNLRPTGLQRRILQNGQQCVHGNAMIERRVVSVHHRGDRHVENIGNAEAFRQRQHTAIGHKILFHQRAR